MVQHLSVYLLTFLMVSRTDAYTESCEASLSTMKNVTECPTNRKSYEKAAHLKNCSSMSDSCKKGAQYHCVLNSELNGLVEVCASSINVYGSVCAKFDENLKGIIRVYDLECQNFSTPCPISYNSTETYKYPECSDVHYTHTSYLTSTISENFGITKNILISARHDQQNVVSIVLGVLFPVLALFSGIVIVIFLRRRNLLCFKTDQIVSESQEEVTPKIPAVAGVVAKAVKESSEEVTPLIPVVAAAQMDTGDIDEVSICLFRIKGKLEEKNIFDDFHATSNKYPAYQHVTTREKSFESCNVSSIKDKALEFARDGFYYEGYHLVTTCFHCGIQKDDWKKDDDIHAEHVKLNQACDFVKYVQLHILKTK